MRIDLRCNGASLREYVTQRMSAATERFRAHIRWARIRVADAQDGTDKRCIVQLRLYNLPDVVFAITRLDERAAIDEAAARAARVLAQRLRRGFGGLAPTPCMAT
ncbi:MAG: HPF/RaiA family ribosome-associated protein [Azoarcus sp.]|nr:HPF/RaiA family ribosome-associated protein [Azoarcus sp.]